MVAEEPTNGGEDYDGAGGHEVERAPDVGQVGKVVIFGLEEGESEEVTGFMLKTPGEVEQQLATFQPEEFATFQPEETSVDTGEEVQVKEEEKKQGNQIPVIVSEELTDITPGEGDSITDSRTNSVLHLEAPSLLVSYIYTPISRWITH